jgi:FkbM family methyltransferase
MRLIQYIKKKIEKTKARKVFKKYGYTVKEFDVAGFGKVKFAQWQNPLEQEKQVTASQVNFFRKFIQPGDFAIDIGAHTGDTTIPMGLAASGNGLVLALDPNPYIFEILTANIALNKELTNILALNAAATKEEGTFFYASSEASFNNGGIATDEKNEHGKFVMQQKVRGINLLQYINQNPELKDKKLSFVKIDTEGHDVVVIESIFNLLKSARPVLVFECFEKLSQQDRFEVFDNLTTIQYRLHYFSGFEENANIIELNTKEDMLKWKHFDVLAKPL